VVIFIVARFLERSFDNASSAIPNLVVIALVSNALSANQLLVRLAIVVRMFTEVFLRVENSVRVIRAGVEALSGKRFRLPPLLIIIGTVVDPMSRSHALLLIDSPRSAFRTFLVLSGSYAL